MTDESTREFDSGAPVSRRDFLAATFLTGASVAAFFGPVGGEARPLPRPDISMVFEPDVFDAGVFD